MAGPRAVEQKSSPKAKEPAAPVSSGKREHISLLEEKDVSFSSSCGSSVDRSPLDSISSPCSNNVPGHVSKIDDTASSLPHTHTTSDSDDMSNVRLRDSLVSNDVSDGALCDWFDEILSMNEMKHDIHQNEQQSSPPLSSHIHHNQEQGDMEDELKFQPDARVWLDTYAGELALPPDLPTSPPPVSHDDETEESANAAISLVENSAENHDAFAHPNSDFSTVSSHVDVPYFLQQDQTPGSRPTRQFKKVLTLQLGGRHWLLLRQNS
jgi:hypothetical protein